MTSIDEAKWQVMIVEDDNVIARQLVEALTDFDGLPNGCVFDLYESFDEAAKHLGRGKYDLLILDLKEDSDVALPEEEEPAGLKVFEELRKTRFTPVIFYTAYAYKVGSEITGFVRVVEKTQGIKQVKQEIQKVISTGLPKLVRYVEEVQRSYMWEFVGRHWSDFDNPSDQSDIAYLLARRLAISLEEAAGNLAALMNGNTPTSSASEKKHHPMVMYVKPPLGSTNRAGDILFCDQQNDLSGYWLILTPTCDLVQNKATRVLLVDCSPLNLHDVYKKWELAPNKDNKNGLEKLLENRHSDRYKFLPKTFFIPDLIVDFQHLRSITLNELKELKRIATLDSPYSESLLASFARYYSRMGTPDVDIQMVMNRLDKSNT